MTTPLVPTLDVAHERGRDLVWCAALPLAWEALRTLLGGSVALRDAPQPPGAAALVAALEAQPPATGAVDPAAFVAAAGVLGAEWTNARPAVTRAVRAARRRATVAGSRPA
ncbi:MAG: hypothetical protein WKG00_21840 [Polyangiaceae bacterium]